MLQQINIHISLFKNVLLASINDGILMLVFAIIFLILYILGVLFPNTTVKFIHQISLKMYKNSENTNITIPSLLIFILHRKITLIIQSTHNINKLISVTIFFFIKTTLFLCFLKP